MATLLRRAARRALLLWAAAGVSVFAADGPAGASAANMTLCQPASTVETERNKCIVIRFYNEALNDKDAERALRDVGRHYIQHNPAAEDDREGLRKFIDWVRADHPSSRSEIVHAFADRDFVILDVRMIRFPEKGDHGLAVGEFFRLEDGKIVEHWDRIQAVPEKSLNAHGMF